MRVTEREIGLKGKQRNMAREREEYRRECKRDRAVYMELYCGMCENN